MFNVYNNNKYKYTIVSETRIRNIIALQSDAVINLRDLLSDYNSRHIAAATRRQRSFSVDIRAPSEQPVRG